jgi:hypothetical protein
MDAMPVVFLATLRKYAFPYALPTSERRYSGTWEKKVLTRRGKAWVCQAQERISLPFGQKDVRDLELGGVGLGLGFRFGRVDSRLLRLDDGQGPAVAIAQHVVGFGAVGQNDLEARDIRVRDLPALVAGLGVDLDA